MTRAGLAFLAVLAACDRTASGNDDPPDTGRVKHHMREHFSDLRTIERLLVAGHLEEAKALAFMLTRPTPSLPTTAESRAVALAAGQLVQARTIEQAVHAEVRVAAACARCHQRMQRAPVFRTPSHAPPDLPTIEAQMARHQWATDRLWEGLIAASDEHWRAGLYVLATSPLPQTPTPSPELARELQTLASQALAKPSPTLDERADIYAKLLLRCAGCHARARVTAPRPQPP
jgi:cytochrome c553